MNCLKISVCGVLLVLVLSAVVLTDDAEADTEYTVTFSLEGEGVLTATVDDKVIASGDKVAAGKSVSIAYVSLDGLHEATAWTVGGTTYSHVGVGAQVFEVTGDLSVEVDSTYCLSGAFYNTYSVELPSKLAFNWSYGEGGIQQGMSWSNMLFTPAFYGDYIYAKLDKVLNKIDLSGNQVSSVDTGAKQAYYNYLAVGNGYIHDASSGKVYDTDLNLVYTVTPKAPISHYYDGCFYVTTKDGTYCFSATDADPSVSDNVQDPIWFVDLDVQFDVFYGGATMGFCDGYIIAIVVDSDENVYLKCVDKSDGSIISSVEIADFKGLYVGKGYLNVADGIVTLTAYGSNESTDIPANIAVADLSSTGILSNLRTAHMGMSGKITSLITNGDYGYVMTGGAFYVLNMSDLSVAAVCADYSSVLVGVHGNMAISTGTEGITKAYVIPYKKEVGGNVYIFTHNMSTGALSVSVQESVIPSAEYCPQQAHFTESGDMVFYNDSGKLFCLKDALPATGISFSESSLTLIDGVSKKLTVNVEPDEAITPALEWSSDNPSVASVTNGIVTANGIGSTVVRASAFNGGLSAECTVTVTNVSTTTFTAYDGSVYTYSISGEGSAAKPYECTLHSATSAGSTLYVPATLEGYNVYFIAPGAFSETSATSVILPKTIRSIGSDAFSGTVTDVYFLGDCPIWTAPSGITVHALSTASGWSGTTDIEVENITDSSESVTTYANLAGTVSVIGCTPSSTGQVIIASQACGLAVTEIGAYAFGQMDPGVTSEKTYRTDIYSVEIPEGVTILRERAFFYNGGMTVVNLPDSLKVICDEAFRGAHSLEAANVPEGVTYIGFEGFRDTTALTTFTVPDSVVFLGEGFIKSQSNESSLRILVVGSGITDFPEFGANNRRSLEVVVFKGELQTIGAYAFQSDALKSVEIPSTVTSIGSSAFNSCKSMERAIISGDVGVDAFRYCSSLVSVDFREMSGRTIAHNAFSNCTSLTDAYFVGEGPSVDVNAFQGVAVNIHYDSAYEDVWSARTIASCTKTADIAGDTQVTITAAPAVVNYPTQLEYAADGSFSNLAWSSSDISVAVISGGCVYGLKEGTFTAKAVSADGVEATAEITVSVVNVTGVTLSQTSAELNSGDKLTLTATVAPYNASYPSVTWASSDMNVATVDDDGNVTAVGGGSCTITVTTVDGDYTATCSVSVTKTSSESNLLIYGVAGAVAVAAIVGVAVIIMRRH